jgi:hypothetical protein
VFGSGKILGPLHGLPKDLQFKIKTEILLTRGGLKIMLASMI